MCEDITNNAKKQAHIFKFGGSCFKDILSFELTLKIIDKYKKDPLIIVCSAFQGITDKLIEFGDLVYSSESDSGIWKKNLDEIRQKHQESINLVFPKNSQIQKEMKDFLDRCIKQLIDYVPKIEQHGMSSKNSDYVVSFGERISSTLFAAYLKMKGFPAEFIPADENLIITDENFGNSLPLFELCEQNARSKLIPLLNDKIILVIPGFYGSTKKNEITTLGRGGSDFSATIVAYSLAKDFDTKVIFWKDVDGILSANPKYVPNAKLLPQLSYLEAKELAYFGSKILHPKCLKMAEQRNIPTEIRNFTNPFSQNYTLITKECIIPQKVNEIVKGITSVEPISMVTIESDAMISLPGSAAQIFSLMGQNKININFISQCSSENNITFGTSSENAIRARHVLTQHQSFGKDWFNVIIEENVALVSVVGAGMKHKPGVAGLLFTTLGNANVNIRAIAQGSAETNITFVIMKSDLDKAIKTIYNAFVNGG